MPEQTNIPAPTLTARNLFTFSKAQTQAVINALLAQHPEFAMLESLELVSVHIEAKARVKAPVIGPLDLDIVAGEDEAG